jgi:alpha-methylacyl-CoA racemase
VTITAPIAGETFRTLPSFPRISGVETEQRYAPPTLGEQSDEILRAMGYTDTEIEQFKKEGIV